MAIGTAGMMTMIMADCNRLGINKTDWILMKVHAALEEGFLAKSKLKEAVDQLLKY